VSIRQLCRTGRRARVTEDPQGDLLEPEAGECLQGHRQEGTAEALSPVIWEQVDSAYLAVAVRVLVWGRPDVGEADDSVVDARDEESLSIARSCFEVAPPALAPLGRVETVEMLGVAYETTRDGGRLVAAAHPPWDRYEIRLNAHLGPVAAASVPSQVSTGAASCSASAT
jgi:hypothetical protein